MSLTGQGETEKAVLLHMYECSMFKCGCIVSVCAFRLLDTYVYMSCMCACVSVPWLNSFPGEDCAWSIARLLSFSVSLVMFLLLFFLILSLSLLCLPPLRLPVFATFPDRIALPTVGARELRCVSRKGDCLSAACTLARDMIHALAIFASALLVVSHE